MSGDCTWEDIVQREESYTPPFSGRGQPVELFDQIHDRWLAWLRANPPEGVPVDAAGWPDTFPIIVDGQMVWDYDETDSEVSKLEMTIQCGGCQYYIPYEGRMGADWGGCSSRKSQYDGRAVFEHWCCKEFAR